MGYHRIAKEKSSPHCSFCFEKQRIIDELQEEVMQLKKQLKVQESFTQDGYFGSSTPSSKLPFKVNTADVIKGKRGAKKGHSGNGRKSHNYDEVETHNEVSCDYDNCPDCGHKLEIKSYSSRSVLESPPKKPEKRYYMVQKKHCACCKKTFQSSIPGVMNKSLFGNQLITNIAEMHYLHGVPIGRISELTGVGDGAIVGIFNRLSKIFENVSEQLISEYRIAEVKHADETSWRVDGKNGYTWLFATDKLSYFCFGENRSSAVPKRVFGDKQLPGVLIVDRYAAYNKAPCKIQYCYAHLIRDIEDLQKRHPESKEVERFVAVLIPLMTEAIKLRMKPITAAKFNKLAAKTKEEIIKVMSLPAKHLGIKNIQQLFVKNESRLYHWANNRDIHADNNLAERDLRPTVVARKVSFGSASQEGAKTRGVLTSIFHTLKKRTRDPSAKFKQTLDLVAGNEKLIPKQIIDFLFCLE
ncbi:MAG: IS66 family transposase [Candidatus Riflebacteria bacterium]|nr:IS66 family transposase [Candidatus Riflebacteria bacterium]